MSQPNDYLARQQALDVSDSFIVQAPAGSGKTELLSQRFLALLATVESPENVVAITFTRKAANEMQQRIFSAISKAATEPEPQAEHAAQTWRLANAALAQDQARNWNLLQQPKRLRIMTIDAFGASLTNQMPLLARLGGSPGMAEDPRVLYEQAAQQVIEDALRNPKSDHFNAAELVLLHLGNRTNQLQGLLATMLGRRDQWGPQLASLVDASSAPNDIEQALGLWLQDAMTEVYEQLGPQRRAAIWPLLQFSAQHLAVDQPQWQQAADTHCFPLPEIDEWPSWQLLLQQCLTGSGSWRKSVTKALGFPPSTEQTTAFKGLLKQWADDTALIQAIKVLATMPPPRFNATDAALVTAITDLLRASLIELQLVFASTGEVDYTEISLRALDALGTDEQPTDLAMRLDYQIQHLLTDEFQDTSRSQFTLFQRLVANWQPGEHRSFFAVGDPMQSIYRFREADVGLFLKAWDEGIGQWPLTALKLTVNFRSQAGLVDWFNQSFQKVFPTHDDWQAGAVSYSRADAWHPASEQAVQLHAAINGDEETEAAQAVQVIQQRWQQQPDADIAILVRSRSRLQAIVPALQQAGIAFRAVDIDPLSSLAVVNDLHALTRALVHPADRVAWLSMLRAPWCGLDVQQLLAIAGQQTTTQALWPMVEALPDCPELERIKPCLTLAMAQRGRWPLRQLVEATWRSLGGAELYPNSRDQQAAQLFFDLLDKLEKDQGHFGSLSDLQQLDDALAKLYAPPDSDPSIQLSLMTIHKSKGLQFDTVILPGLNRGGGQDDPAPLQWMESPVELFDGSRPTLIAPIKADGGQQSTLYQYIVKADQQRADHELARLLYVAVTRAEQQLHLMGSVKETAKGDRRPSSRTLLKALWPVVESGFLSANAITAADDDSTALHPAQNHNNLARIASDYQAPMPDWGLPITEVTPVTPQEAIEYEWASETLRHVGVVVHRLLQQIADDGLQHWQPERLSTLKAGIQKTLKSAGVDESDLGWASGLSIKAMQQTLADPKGRWLLDNHPHGQTEWPLTGLIDGDIVQAVIDRSFVDAAGNRWIVDYKTGRRDGGDTDAFIAEEVERYGPQLQRYGRLVSQLDQRPIKLALYFPLMERFVEL